VEYRDYDRGHDRHERGEWEERGHGGGHGHGNGHGNGHGKGHGKGHD
jgi:hypothetical protein